MGSKKVAVIDDSVEEEVKKTTNKKKGEDSSGADQSVSEQGESDQMAQALTSETSDEPVDEVDASSTGEQSESEPKKKTATSKEKKEAKKESRSQKFMKVKALVDPSKEYTLNEAIALTKQTSFTKFDGTIEAHFNIKNKGFRVSMTLPHPVKGQKEKKMLIFADGIGDLAAKDSNIMVGNKQTVEKILSGELIPGKDFQMVIATPAFMVDLAGVAKTLGPKGLMPNPKNGTITDDVEKTLKSFAGGQIEVKGDPTAPIVHLAVGKVSWEAKNVEENIDAATNAVGKNSIVKLTLNATMGPGIVVTL